MLQTELLGHIWSGSGSSPTPVVRALLPLREWRVRVPLQAGVPLRAEGSAGGALALDAHALVSLWHRTARARLTLRAALHAHVSAHVRTAWASLHARTHTEAEARLHIATHLDFYDGVSLCVRADIEPHSLM